MADQGPLVELVNATKNYGDSLVLKDLSITVNRGDSLAVVGPSGSGKSTLLNLMGCLDTPTSGQVRIEGEDTSLMSQDDLAMIRNKKIGFVFQLHHLLPQLTLLENVLTPTIINPDPAADHRARALLDRVGLSKRLDYLPGKLSGGERQRAALVRALINKPSLILADEPTGSLDRNGAAEMAELLKELNSQEGAALVVVTHSADLAGRMDKVFELSNSVLNPWKADR